MGPNDFFTMLGQNIDSLVIFVLIIVVLFFMEKDRRKSDAEADEIDAEVQARLKEIANDYRNRRKTK